MNSINSLVSETALPYLAFYDKKAVNPSAIVKVWKPKEKVADYKSLSIDWEKPDEIIDFSKSKVIDENEQKILQS